MKKTFPDFATDAEAEAFVDRADLSGFDFSDMKSTSFVLRGEARSVHLTLPSELIDEIERRVEETGVPFDRFVELAIGRSLRKPR